MVARTHGRLSWLGRDLLNCDYAVLGVRGGDAAGVHKHLPSCAQLDVDGLDAAEVEVLGVAGGLVAHRERPRGVEGRRVEGTDGILCKLWRRGEVVICQ